MEYIALLRGVTPTGKNRIPSMAALAEALTCAGLRQVRTYIQSGNILFETPLPEAEAAGLIRRVIREQTGAELSVILKTAEQLSAAARGNPFTKGFDPTRVHLVFTNDPMESRKVENLQRETFDGEAFAAGEFCLYLYLPRNAAKKRLNTNYLEKRLGVTATMRKLSVVMRLAEMGGQT